MVIQRDKWLQYRLLRKLPSLAARIPETKLLTQKTLTNMLLRYQSVVLKPRDGSYGRDILFIQPSDSNSYQIQNEDQTVIMKDMNQLFQWLRKAHKGRGYIVQQRLDLAQIQQEPFDLRIMVQRTQRSPSAWKVTGSYAKVAEQGYLVTNVNSHTIPVLEALETAEVGGPNSLINVERIARLAAKRLGKHYRSLRQVGLDIGIDRKGKVWIIEANYRPDLRPFRALKDPSMYRKILWYKKH